MCGAEPAGNIANDLPQCYNNTFIKERKEVKQMAKKKLSKFAAISMAAAMMLTAVMPTIPVFAAETVCTHPKDALDWAYPYKKNPTCQETGLTDEICTICGAVVHADVVVPKDGHSYNVESVKNSVITDDGIDYGTITSKCKWCGKEMTSKLTKDPEKCEHWSQMTYTEGKNATCEEDGYTGDFICTDCGTVIKGEVTSAYGHHWNNGEVTKVPTTLSAGEKTYTCINCKKTKTEEIAKLPETSNPIENTKNDPTVAVPSKSVVKEGSKFIVSGNTYKVTKENEEVRFIKAKKNAKTVIIPATVTNKGVTYKVTSIAAKAVKNNKKVKSVVIGANVKSISNNAFIKCPALKKVNIKSTLLTKKTASKKALKSVNKKLTVKVPKKVKKEYKKIFKGLKIK